MLYHVQTPAYALNMSVLRRAEQLFANPSYIYVHRHPYSSIAAMEHLVMEQEWPPELDRALIPSIAQTAEDVRRDREPQDVLHNVTWDFTQDTWANSNSNIISFLQEVRLCIDAC